MGNFNSEYESYYSSIVNKKRDNTTLNRGMGTGFSLKSNKSRKSKSERIIRKIIQDLCGVLAMFIFVLVCKNVSTPQTTKAYKYCKNVVNESYDYKKAIYTIKNGVKGGNFQDKIINEIEKVKSKLTGDKTIINKIKENFQLPIEGKVLSCTNEGVDIGNLKNMKVNASSKGIVKECGDSEEQGKYIVIDHGKGIETKYSNLYDVKVKENDTVNKGQVIGNIRESKGNEKVHFEILFMGQNKGLEKNLGTK